jgi:beta-exotoxin I transport system permease protein
MTAIFRQTLRRLGGQILGWGIAIALISAGVASLYETIAKQQDTLQQLINSYPPEMLAFFGDAAAMFTPSGFLGVELFSFMPLILGVFAIVTGSSLLAADEENGTMDLFLAHPISRAQLYAGRLAAFVTAVVGILAMIWAGLVLGARGGSLGLTPVELARPFLSLGAVLLLMGALALTLSLLLPSRRTAAMLAGLVLFGSYIATSVARINDNLKPLAQSLPLDYYQGGAAILHLNLGWLLGLLVASVVCAVLGGWLFQRRDIRVGGEGSWDFGRLRRQPSR